MTIRGKVKNGKVVLEKPRAFAEGTEVEVRPVKVRKSSAKKTKAAKPKGCPRSLAERLRNVIGKAKNLPSDMSVNHDHHPGYGSGSLHGPASPIEHDRSAAEDLSKRENNCRRREHERAHRH